MKINHQRAIIAGLAIAVGSAVAAPLTYKQVQARANWIDTNKDGVLDANEIAAAKHKYGKQVDTILIGASDANKDGRITVAEAINGNAFGEWERTTVHTSPRGTSIVTANGQSWKTEDGRAWDDQTHAASSVHASAWRDRVPLAVPLADTPSPPLIDGLLVVGLRLRLGVDRLRLRVLLRLLLRIDGLGLLLGAGVGPPVGGLRMPCGAAGVGELTAVCSLASIITFCTCSGQPHSQSTTAHLAPSSCETTKATSNEARNDEATSKQGSNKQTRNQPTNQPNHGPSQTRRLSLAYSLECQPTTCTSFLHFSSGAELLVKDAGWLDWHPCRGQREPFVTLGGRSA